MKVFAFIKNTLTGRNEHGNRHRSAQMKFFNKHNGGVYKKQKGSKWPARF